MVDAVLFDWYSIQLRVGDQCCELTIIDSQIQAEGERISFARIAQALTLSCDQNVSRLQ